VSTNDPESEHRITRWEIVTWGMRFIVLATVPLLLVTRDIPYALFGIGGLLLASVPALLARSGRARFPAALELVLLWLIIADLTVGRLGGLYEVWPWYDKALHFTDAFLIAMTAFVVVYLFHFIGHTRPHRRIDGILILLITLGLGALWELGEYGADRVLDRATQGSPRMAPLDDTMFDLLLDGAGGVLAAFAGPLYVGYSKRSRRRIEALGCPHWCGDHPTIDEDKRGWRPLTARRAPCNTRVPRRHAGCFVFGNRTWRNTHSANVMTNGK